MEMQASGISSETLNQFAVAETIHVGDNVFQATFDEYQALLRSNEVTLTKGKSIREELQQYVDSLPSKTDSEGNNLIHMPSNFDHITEAMTRADLTLESDHQWSKTLLEKQFNSDFENGRYKNEFKNAAEKIERGLAEIQLLDNILKAKSKKATVVNRQLSDASEVASIARSQQSIFITRTKLDEDGLHSRNSHITGSPNMGRRSSRLDSPKSRKSEYEDSDHEKEDDDNEEVDDNEGGTSASMPRSDDETPTKVDNATKGRKKTSFYKSKLSDDEELRIQTILHDDYDKYVEYSLFLNKKKLEEIDRKLDDFGRLDRLDVETLDVDIVQQHNIKESSSKKSKDKKVVDYLQSQKKERALTDYERKIDSLLKKLKEEDFRDLSTLLSEQSPRESERGSLSQKGRRPSQSNEEGKSIRSEKSLLSVPTCKEIIKSQSRKISAGDIELVSDAVASILKYCHRASPYTLIQECKEEMRIEQLDKIRSNTFSRSHTSQISEAGNNSSSQSYEAIVRVESTEQLPDTSDTLSLSSKDVLLKNNEGFSMPEYQLKFDRLLASIRGECETLSAMRNLSKPSISSISTIETDNLLNSLAARRRSDIPLHHTSSESSNSSEESGTIEQTREPDNPNDESDISKIISDDSGMSRHWRGSALLSNMIPNSNQFAQREKELMRKLADKTEELRLPPISKIDSVSEKDILSAASSKLLLSQEDKAMHKLFRR